MGSGKEEKLEEIGIGNERIQDSIRNNSSV